MRILVLVLMFMFTVSTAFAGFSSRSSFSSSRSSFSGGSSFSSSRSSIRQSTPSTPSKPISLGSGSSVSSTPIKTNIKPFQPSKIVSATPIKPVNAVKPAKVKEVKSGMSDTTKAAIGGAVVGAVAGGATVAAVNHFTKPTTPVNNTHANHYDTYMNRTPYNHSMFSPSSAFYWWLILHDGQQYIPADKTVRCDGECINCHKNGDKVKNW